MRSIARNSANTNNAELINKGGTTVRSIVAFNAGGAAAYLKLYDTAAAPTVGTDRPVMVIAVPTVSTVTVPLKEGYRFALGLGIGMVTGAADTDNTAVAANQLKVNFVYDAV
jgi:hypothetical protein